MKKILLLLCLLPLACKTSTGVNTENTQEVNAEKIKESDYRIEDEDIARVLSFLASDELQGRDSGAPGLEKAAEYIEARWKKNGVSPFYPGYRDTITNFSKPTFNVVGVVQGIDPELKDEYILLGAHYDHIGIQEGEGADHIANGANDNASGTTAVVELANYFAQRGNLKRSVIFALFTAEEHGLLGSEHLAKRMKEEGIDLYAMINFEMIGVPMKREELTYITGYKLSNMAEVINGYAGEALVGFLPQAAEYNLFKRSDNYSFYELYGVPAQTISTFDFNNYAYYHKVDDEFEYMDIAHMGEVIRKTIPVIRGIANHPGREIRMNE